jgi:hypothetical protein
MAQTGFTPLQIYSSSTAAAAPAAGNLTNSTLGSELAINITDGKLFYKDNANAVQVIGWKTVPTTAGGTGLTSYTAGDLLYYASGTALSKLGIGAANTVLTSSGTAPQWSTGLALTSASSIEVTDNTNPALRITQLGTGYALLVEDETNPDASPFVVTATGQVGMGVVPDATYQLDIANSSTSTGADTYVRARSLATTGDADVEFIADAKGTGEPAFRLKTNDVSNGAFYATNDQDYIVIANDRTNSDLLFLGSESDYEDSFSLRYIRNTGAAPVTGITGTVSTAAATSTVTGLSTTTGLVVGMRLTQTAGPGNFGAQTYIKSIDSATQITVKSATAAVMTTGSITFTATPTPTTIHATSSSSSSAWAVDQDFARFAFGNGDATGAGDGGIKASINAYVYDAGGTGAGLDFYVSSNGTTLTKAMRLTQTGVYGTTVGGTYRTAYIDNTGILGGLTSLRAAKTNISNIENVSFIYDLNPVAFNYRVRDQDGNWTNEASARTEFGLIADDVEKIVPELCIYDNDAEKTGLRGVEYTRLIAPMLKAIQEQQLIIQKLENRLEQAGL